MSNTWVMQCYICCYIKIIIYYNLSTRNYNKATWWNQLAVSSGFGKFTLDKLCHEMLWPQRPRLVVFWWNNYLVAIQSVEERDADDGTLDVGEVTEGWDGSALHLDVDDALVFELLEVIHFLLLVVFTDCTVSTSLTYKSCVHACTHMNIKVLPLTILLLLGDV